MSANHRTAAKLLSVLAEFRKFDPEMQAQTMVVFILIAKAGPDGIRMKDLEEHAGVRKSSISRNVALLSERHRSGVSGLNLVEKRLSPEDIRQKVIRLTTRGRAVWHSIQHAMGEGVEKDEHAPRLLSGLRAGLHVAD